MNVVDLHKGVQWINQPSIGTFMNTCYAVHQTDTHGSIQNQQIQSTSPKSLGNMGTPLQGFAYQNAGVASFRDVVVRPDEGVHEVLAKHFTPSSPKNQDTVIAVKEVQKAAEKTEVFLLHTMTTLPEEWAEWCKQDDNLKDHIIGVVDATNFEEYYNFFAPLWLNSKQEEERNSSVSSSPQTRKRKRNRSCSPELETKCTT